MQIIDNINKTVKDDLQAGIHKGSKMSVAAACFSIYAYQELKKQLEGIDELRFIFTSPTFVTEKTSKAQREFYIPRISRESSLYGTEFEVKLRNELTQKAIAKECADWIRRKAVFKSNVTQEQQLSAYERRWNVGYIAPQKEKEQFTSEEYQKSEKIREDMSSLNKEIRAYLSELEVIDNQGGTTNG